MARLLSRVSISDLKGHIGQTVRLRGWVHAIRDQKRVHWGSALGHGLLGHDHGTY
jgi:hypothetical protein